MSLLLCLIFTYWCRLLIVFAKNLDRSVSKLLDTDGFPDRFFSTKKKQQQKTRTDDKNIQKFPVAKV